ncbi:MULTISPECIES: pyridoxal 5'-phosphate synthase glutaminase subunit PdxT [unclassified Planococcus (in: firmicutes)]|uniref:pyridoxal 5'-phosphate synthase glutaminase subunit PdxT n=1 Tax=Planococcus TaxID=1372 RepID=UPI000C3415AD|nr:MULTISPECIES: pyridoxal 5'-phosphate synthase glutaminase subunit PdxT [unclassified Planococcus (in: firmicutes)]AUD12524.1 pyridoxal 5'-phosphate synthase glutaminase subunit PdxT [Planococcus sp. MB-3u-03]PKG44373.1 pyridoxal 5'-phosphate synthase glutaminase subunit PdxT [Planococcus sp. Urea-trap-24]PKG90874.1 pyridoxal 5'-phosphate synthase glutaminase subunit PdxT [Planococcus sp. Urea-3u-39]PKH38404.1 pyridoxal 5'-phosphate synthase glutaminase subunit PdxT [Planococcus sp. MB-3u-09]
MKIGVLALQGAVREHVQAIQACGAEAVVVKKAAELEELDGLVLPGGESTAMRRLIDRAELLEPLKQFAQADKPMFGTCAGLVLLAKEIDGQEAAHLGVMDMTVARNSFGRQVDSFEADLDIVGIDAPFPAVFIRAPHIVRAGVDVEVLCEYEGRIVLARSGPFLGCSFHPELTGDHRLMQLFLDMVENRELLPTEAHYSKI